MNQRLPNGFLGDNAPRNMWWVAARRDEITTTPMARWLLEMPVVLFRTEDGTAVALDDRCPHRWAPLSEGRVDGDQIVCPYHGMRFGIDGRCTLVPTQAKVPPGTEIAHYPLRASGAFVWIWMGDPAVIDDHDPPVDLGYTADPDWSVVLGYYDVACNWVLIRENVLDLTHLPFLHAETFRQNDWDTIPTSSIDGDVITYRQSFDPAPLSPLFCHAMGFDEDEPVARTQVGTMPSLGVSFSDWHVTDPAPAPGARTEFLMRGCHIVTPGLRGRTHYYWGAAFDIADVADEAIEISRRNVTEAFDEDKHLLERMQAQLEQDPRRAGGREVSLAADGAGLRVRQVLQRRLAAEGRQLP